MRGKAAVERFFRTLSEGLLAALPGYKGPDVYSRGTDPEGCAYFFTNELEQVIREWVGIYHRRPHAGLADPRVPGLELSPAAAARQPQAPPRRHRDTDPAWPAALQASPRLPRHPAWTRRTVTPTAPAAHALASRQRPPGVATAGCRHRTPLPPLSRFTGPMRPARTTCGQPWPGAADSFCALIALVMQ
jgi:hypothetical protein